MAVDLMLTEEQEQIVAAVADFLKAELPVSRMREARGLDAQAAWQRLAEAGWLAIALDEAHGGAALGPAEEALVFREFGRHLLPPAVLASTLAARVAARAGQSELAQALASGRARAALLTGGHLYDSRAATHVLDWDAQHARVWHLAKPLLPVPCIDPGLSLAMWPASGATELARAAAENIAQEARLLCAAMLTGVAEAVRDLSVSYACERQQFGRPIGSFQAVKHPCADMAVAAEAALSQLKVAALSLARQTPDADFQILAAKIVAHEGALRSARRSIQIHGGMGITAECLAHFFLKRVHVLGEIAGRLPQLQDELLALDALTA